ncbi:unnamed protein product [Camellia sinensis]
MMNKWEELVSEKKSCELDVSSYEEGRRIFELQIEQSHLLSKTQQSLIPGSRFLPTKTNKRMKEINNEVEALVREMINEKEKAMKMGKAGWDDNLLGMLLKANLKEIEEHGNDEAGISIQEVIEECKLFYFVEQETTANLLV